MAAVRRERSRRTFHLSSKLAAMHLAPFDHDSVPDTCSTASVLSLSAADMLELPPESSSCDACPHCSDTCGDDQCSACTIKNETADVICCQVTKSLNASSATAHYTMCQVRRHNHEGSAWLVAGDTIYDATSYMHNHPGGVKSILRKAGGEQDCTRDFQFHSRQGKQLFKKCEVGKLRECSCSSSSEPDAKQQWWAFWFR